MEINHTAFLTGLDQNQYVVRLENLGTALDGIRCTLATLQEQLDHWQRSPDSDTGRDALAFLENFCEHWNSSVRRQNRPAFAAFYDEVEPESEAPDWANRLRNRLGLSHYAAPLVAVALVRYRVSEVLRDLSGTEVELAFAVPTVLDGELNVHFFPTPRSAQYGRTLALEPDPDCERLVSEILHRRIDYHPEHIY